MSLHKSIGTVVDLLYVNWPDKINTDKTLNWLYIEPPLDPPLLIPCLKDMSYYYARPRGV